MAHIIVVGNEKGGAGKSTVAMHVASALARMGHQVGTLDLDLRQRSLGRYIENRVRFLGKEGLELPTPRDLLLPEAGEVPDGTDPQDARLSAGVAALEATSDFIVIDCPGSHTRL